VIALQKSSKFGVKREYVRVIENGSTSELMAIFEKHISPEAKVLTDKCKGYGPITKSYNIVQEKSSP